MAGRISAAPEVKDAQTLNFLHILNVPLLLLMEPVLEMVPSMLEHQLESISALDPPSINLPCWTCLEPPTKLQS